jgi:5-methylcytosine-specific restriction endonuclease McrA
MDYKAYHQDWRDVIRPMILKRDQYKCRSCGIKHKSEVYRKSKGHYIELDGFMKQWALDNGKKVFTLFLQVAHINHKKTDNRPENLITLCPYHHGKFDSEHKKISRIIYQRKTADNKPEVDKPYNEEIVVQQTTLQNQIKLFTGVFLTHSQVNQIISIIKTK